MSSATFSADATANDYDTALSLATAQARSEAFATLGQNISFDRTSASDKINPDNTYTVSFTTTATQVEVPTPVPANGDEALAAIPPARTISPVGDEAIDAANEAELARIRAEEGVAVFAPAPASASGDEAIDAANEAELARIRAEEGVAVFGPSPAQSERDDAAATDAANEAELARIRAEEGVAVFGPAPVLSERDDAAAVDAEAARAANLDPYDFAAAAGAAAQSQLRDQFTLQQRFNTSSQGDWRVRLRLAPGAKYLYKAEDPGILRPLVPTDGIIFPYTPTIQTQYSAKYDSYNLTHSNYRGYFYQSSQVGDITVTGTFTAQDTAEAEYLLAVIHFFRSVTKMFYGKDPQRGSPPPLVELSGFGEYQFNNHPCLVASFNYTLPNNVDYIQVKPNNQGLNMSDRTSKVSSSPASTIESVLRRLQTSLLPKGAQGTPVDLGVVRNTVNGLGQTTYVPTKIEISIVLHPLQTRQQVSQGFSLENFAKGNLLKGGFW